MNSIRGNSFTRRQALQFGGLGLGLLAAGALAGCSPSTPAAMPT